MIVPPFCAHAVFTLQSIIPVSRESYLVRKFPQRLENEKLQSAWTLAERQKLLRENYIKEQLRHLTVVLGREDMQLRRDTLRAWDKSMHDGGLERLVVGSGVKIEGWKKVWKVGAESWKSCPVCGVEFEEESTKEEKKKGEEKFKGEKNGFCEAFSEYALDQWQLARIRQTSTSP